MACEQWSLLNFPVHIQSWYSHLLVINVFTCGMFQTAAFDAFHNFLTPLLPSLN